MQHVDRPPDRPVVIFDGDCGFCRFWIARWQQRTGAAVEYAAWPHPDLAERFPEIPSEQFARAVQLVEPDGRVTEGAEAVFRLLAISGRPSPLWAYEHLPGLAPITEHAYRLVADHRPFWAGLTALLWGRVAERSTYTRATWLFLRLLGIAYLFAFWSLNQQILGLVGHDGILPADQYLSDARTLPALSRFWMLPTLTWVSVSDTALRGFCLGGVALSSLLVVGVLPWIVLPLLWLIYLSLSVVCGEFLSYQWDALLLETGFLAIFLAPLVRRERPRTLTEPPRIAIRLMLWLLFRLLVSSGAVKLASGDDTWHSLTALAFHFETQPLPTPVAWYFHWFPPPLLKMMTAATLAIEIGAPLLIVAPRRLRALGFVLIAGLQVLIALTGNYAFFNLLTIALCCFLLDDVALGRWGTLAERTEPSSIRRGLLLAVAVVTVPVSVIAFTRAIAIDLPGAAVVEPLAVMVSPFRSVNGYGLFAVMTTTRPEIVIEGSEDGETWQEYEFKYKAGDVHRRPPWIAPHQPRLDWQMWFAALGQFDSEPWFQRFCVRLLEADATVLKLLERDPFEGRRPKYLRAVLYRYRFSDSTIRGRDGAWWTREPLGRYSPTLSLSTTASRR